MTFRPDLEAAARPEPRPPTARAPRAAYVHCGLFRIAPDGLERPGLCGAADELVLLIDIVMGTAAPTGPRELVVECWRGDLLRDRQRQQVPFTAGGRWSAAFRLHWTGRPDGSTRLRCRVLLDGQEIGDEQALLGRPEVDAQGRLAGPAPAASPATLLAFEQALLARLDDR